MEKGDYTSEGSPFQPYFWRIRAFRLLELYYGQQAIFFLVLVVQMNAMC